MLNKKNNSEEKPIICVFAKPPALGNVKTRLIGTFGQNKTRQLAEAFLVDTLESLRLLEWADIVIATTFPHGTQMESLTKDVEILDQGEGDLGARIERVMETLLKRSPRVFAMGADTPGLPPDRLEAAEKLLLTHDCVIGPAEDGGFYLLGLKRCPPGLLERLPWGTPDTYQNTVNRLRERGFSVAALKPWFDVDRPDDLRTLFELIKTRAVSAPTSERAIKQLAIRD